MLEDMVKVGSPKATEIQREVEPVSPYPRINPQHSRLENDARPVAERKTGKSVQARRRFNTMRGLVEQLKKIVQIVRVDFNTALQEVCDQGLAIVEEELIPQLQQLKIPATGIDELIQQLQQQSTGLTPVSGRTLTATFRLFPIFVEGLAEYILRFDDLQIAVGWRNSEIFDEIRKNGRFVTEQNRMRLSFRPLTSNLVIGDPLRLTIGLQVGAIEIDETGHRAILYQRPDQSYGLYSDKSISLSI